VPYSQIGQKINVQNEKPPMNLDRPFFGDSKFGKLYS